MNDFDEYLVAGEPDKRERAYGWATAIGLQDVDGLKVSDFLLKTAKRNIEGEITESEARKIVDEYYETKEGHDQPDVEHFTSFISGLWQIHPFREGNTRAVAVFAIKYLRSMGYNVTNDLFAEKSWYFRNALVRANYENRSLDVDKTQLPLEEFFKVLLYGYELELKNRYLRIGYEYGSQKAEAVKNLHRHDAVESKGDVGINVGINVGIKYNDVLSRTEENAVKAILRDNRITAKALSVVLGVTLRQAERIMVSLKKKANLRREGSRKNGHWVFGD